jgi:hypothetical protein
MMADTGQTGVGQARKTHCTRKECEPAIGRPPANSIKDGQHANAA